MANYDITPYGLWKEIQKLRKKICCNTAVLAQYTTVERDALASPYAGQLIYNTTTNKLNFYNGTSWEEVTSA